MFLAIFGAVGFVALPISKRCKRHGSVFARPAPPNVEQRERPIDGADYAARDPVCAF